MERNLAAEHPDQQWPFRALVERSKLIGVEEIGEVLTFCVEKTIGKGRSDAPNLNVKPVENNLVPKETIITEAQEADVVETIEQARLRRAWPNP